jgi:lactate permease
VALLAFGLNWSVLWVAEGKALLLTLNVILLLWPGIFIYYLVDQMGGIRAIAMKLDSMVHDKGWLLILQAWMLSNILESLAGFGLPIAMVAPLLIAMGVEPVLAVAVASVGHTWAGSTGGMALSLRVLSEITHYTPDALFPHAAILLGVSIVLTGLAVAFMLGEKRQWWRVLITGSVAAVAHYFFGVWGMIPISALLASVTGFLVGSTLSKNDGSVKAEHIDRVGLRSGLVGYGTLVSVILTVSLIPPVNKFLSSFIWTVPFPQVATATGVATPAENGNLLHIFTHPGSLILFTLALIIPLFKLIPAFPTPDLRKTLRSTLRSAVPASLGSLFMISLSTLMEHTGMTQVLAQGLSNLAGSFYPMLAPLVGMLGSFATGSNVNSNVLFGALQKTVAVLVGASPLVMLGAQTTGGSLGSMIAPAKLTVGVSTSSELKNREGEVLRKTLPVS